MRSIHLPIRIKIVIQLHRNLSNTRDYYMRRVIRGSQIQLHLMEIVRIEISVFRSICDNDNNIEMKIISSNDAMVR